MRPAMGKFLALPGLIITVLLFSAIGRMLQWIGDKFSRLFGT